MKWLTRALVRCLLSLLPPVNPGPEELVVHLLLLPGTLPLDHFICFGILKRFSIHKNLRFVGS